MSKFIDKIKNAQFDILELPSRGVFYNTGRSFFYVKYLTAKEENILTSPGFSETSGALDAVLESVLIEDIAIDDLISVDRKALILFLRSTSFGDSFEMDLECPSCRTKSKETFRFSQIEMSDIEINKNTKFSIDFKTDNKSENFYKIEYRALTYGEEKEVKAMDSIKIVTNEIIAKIQSINQDKDREYIKKFVKSLSLKKFQELKNEINKSLPSILEELKFECSNCGHVEKFPFLIDDGILKLEPNYRNNFEDEVFLIQYYGKGGFDRDSIYDMSILRRRKTLERINEEIEKKNKAEEAAIQKSKNSKGKR